MTQAFNLAQFANFLNSSGQVSGSGLQSGLATQWTASGSNIYFFNKITVGGSSIPTGQFDFIRTVSDSAREEIGRLSRVGGTALYGSSREGVLGFYDADNGTLVGGIGGVRYDPTSNHNGGVVLYVNNTGASSATAVTSLTKAMEIDNSSVMRFNSGYGSVAPVYGCRAWVNFNGTGAVAIRASGNVSSITDNGTGDYTVNFTTAMPDANYAAVQGYTPSSGTNCYVGQISTRTTTSVRMSPYLDYNNGLNLDMSMVSVSIFR